MKALVTTLALAGTLLAVPAYAFQCPADMAKIDAAIQAGTNLTAAQLDKVKSLRAEGERLHKAGKHGESVEALGEALDMLGM